MDPRRRRRILRLAMFAILCVVGVIMLFPFVLMIVTSLRSKDQYVAGSGFSLDSWNQLFATVPVLQQLLNSTIVTVGGVSLILIVSTMGGYAFSKLTFLGSGVVLLAILSWLMIPMQSIIIPEYVNLGKLGLINTYLGAILVYVALGTPFATFLMATYYRGISDDLIEAAVMDGLGYERTFLRIALPLSWPALATVTVLQFIQIWDDLLVGLLFLQNPQQRTITVGLAALSAGRTTSIPVLMAGSLVSALPAIIVYLIFQRHLVKGLTLGMGK